MISFFSVERGAGKRRAREGGVIYFTSVGSGGLLSMGGSVVLWPHYIYIFYLFK